MEVYETNTTGGAVRRSFQDDGFVPGSNSRALRLANEAKQAAVSRTPAHMIENFKGGIRFRHATQWDPAGYYWYWVIK